MKSFYMNLSIKYKIIIWFYLLNVVLLFTFGYYAYQISSKQIIEKVSMTNLRVTNEVENNITEMQKNISDWITLFSLSTVVQEELVSESSNPNRLESALYSGPTPSMIDELFYTKYFDYLALYSTGAYPLLQEATDGSNGPGSLSQIHESYIYQKTLELKGASYWFSLNGPNHTFIQNNRNDKIGMTRIVRNVFNGDSIGFIFMGINQETIRERYLRNLFDDQHGIIILDENDSPLIQAGKVMDLSSPSTKTAMAIFRSNESGSAVIKVNGEDLLITYSGLNDIGWKIVYLVPLSHLMKELSSIKTFLMIMILACLLLCLPFMMILTSIITTPIKKLVTSMEKLQKGNFEERVEIKYRDEVGILNRGYNLMVKNMKELINEVYILQLKEKEAELKALQSQINPHFLYNTLDTIFWEAEAAGQTQISEMIIRLSRLFRLSLNRGKSSTNIAKEKEMLELYLSLQKMRFKDSVDYRIDIPDELNSYVIMKLVLQPFIENALIHGIERKRGGGHITVFGELMGNQLRFLIEDTGVGMGPDTLQRIMEDQPESNVDTDNNTGGYAIQNIRSRLQYFYNDHYQLSFISKPDQGTKVELIIPAILDVKEVNG